MRGLGMRAAIAMAALSMASGAPAVSAPVSRIAIMPSEPARLAKRKRENKNSTPKNRFRNRPSKLARRLRRKFELGMMGAF
jgi:hypothetical protein